MTPTLGGSTLIVSQGVQNTRYDLTFIPGPLNTIAVPPHFKHWGAIEKTEISANYPACSARTVLTKQ